MPAVPPPQASDAVEEVRQVLLGQRHTTSYRIPDQGDTLKITVTRIAENDES